MTDGLRRDEMFPGESTAALVSQLCDQPASLNRYRALHHAAAVQCIGIQVVTRWQTVPIVNLSDLYDKEHCCRHAFCRAGNGFYEWRYTTEGVNLERTPTLLDNFYNIVF
ncbi:MAG: hypothetical protein ACYC7E_17240 [Armatimonadota bacterium]